MAPDPSPQGGDIISEQGAAIDRNRGRDYLGTRGDIISDSGGGFPRNHHTPVGASPDGKPLMNANVAIELGYSLTPVGTDGLIMVMNRAYGERGDLPFDPKYKRGPIEYTLLDDADRARVKTERLRLAKALEAALRACVKFRPALAAAKPKLLIEHEKVRDTERWPRGDGYNVKFRVLKSKAIGIPFSARTSRYPRVGLLKQGPYKPPH